MCVHFIDDKCMIENIYIYKPYYILAYIEYVYFVLYCFGYAAFNANKLTYLLLTMTSNLHIYITTTYAHASKLMGKSKV